MINLHAVIHEAVTADTDRLVGFHRTSLRSDGEWDHKIRYEFDDGSKVELSPRFSNSIAVPAREGFELLTADRPRDWSPEDLARDVRSEPVLAWTLEYEHGQGSVEPITTSGFNTTCRTNTCKAIRLPDGSVQWHAPFDRAACSLMDDQFGRDWHRENPVLFGNTAAWLDLVARVWAAQIVEEDKRLAANSCPGCGRARSMADDDIPF